MNPPVLRALVSVSNKEGLLEFAHELARRGVTILSTGGTARLLRGDGIDAIDVSAITGFPEIMDGRVKTLHPKIHGGLLCRRDKPDHLAAAEKHGISLIDLVVTVHDRLEQARVAHAFGGGVTVIQRAGRLHTGGRDDASVSRLMHEQQLLAQQRRDVSAVHRKARPVADEAKAHRQGSGAAQPGRTA